MAGRVVRDRIGKQVAREGNRDREPANLEIDEVTGPGSPGNQLFGSLKFPSPNLIQSTVPACAEKLWVARAPSTKRGRTDFPASHQRRFITAPSAGRFSVEIVVDMAGILVRAGTNHARIDGSGAT